MTLRLTFATWDHDRTAALHDGRVGVPGVELDCVTAPTTTLFPLAASEARYDVTELSLSSHILQVSRGEGAYIAIPAFLSRAFRHGGFFARQGSGVEAPGDLAGRRVGVPEYQMTAALWMRGILMDEYGVAASSIRWRTGALDAGIRRERLALALPEGFSVEPITEGETLQGLLLDGRIDGLLAPKPPAAFLSCDPRVVRLLPDYEAAERDWHRRTGYFPIMHAVGIRRTIAEAHPWLPAALLTALTEARDLAVARLREVWLGSANRLTLPWLGATLERTVETMGEDYWSYGYRANAAELAAMCRYSREQHLAVRDVDPEELFHRSTLT